jgi:hypothetical protein
VRTQGVWAGDGVEVTVSGFFTTHHLVQTPTGILGEFTLSAFSTGGVFTTADGRELEMRKTNWWRGWHEMREDGVVVGTAHSQGFWQRTMSIGFRGATYELVPAGCWSRGWCLLDGTEATVIEVYPRGAFQRGAYLTVVEPVHVDLLAFAYYLVNVRWQDQSAAAVAATGS